MNMQGHYSSQSLGTRGKQRIRAFERVSEERQLAMCNDYTSGMAKGEIEHKYRVHHRVLYAILDRHGVERRMENSEDAMPFNWREASLIDKLRGGLSLPVAAYLSGFSLNAAETIVARARVAMRL